MQIFKSLVILPIRFYRYIISPMTGPSCRFHPSCSAYGQEAVNKHGLIKGGWLTFKRICRCHPYGACGHDPVPDNVQWFSSLIVRNKKKG